MKAFNLILLLLTNSTIERSKNGFSLRIKQGLRGCFKSPLSAFIWAMGG